MTQTTKETNVQFSNCHDHQDTDDPSQPLKRCRLTSNTATSTSTTFHINHIVNKTELLDATNNNDDDKSQIQNNSATATIKPTIITIHNEAEASIKREDPVVVGEQNNSISVQLENGLTIDCDSFENDSLANDSMEGNKYNNHYQKNKNINQNQQQLTALQTETDCSSDDENDGEDDVDSDDEQPISLKFLIRRREAGAIIGKKGANIRQLRDMFSSEFLIPDTGNGPERVLNIITNSKVINQILKQLSELLHEKSCSLDGDEQVELRMLIHSSHAGTIIGKGGMSIRKLRDESKAAIKIFALCCPLSNERVVAIKGKPSIVVTTIKLILNIISASCIKGVVKPYDALNFDQSISDRYGGYSDETDIPSKGSFQAPQKLSPSLPFMTTNPFNPVPPNQFFSNSSYRLLSAPANSNMNPHQHCVPCKPIFSANQFPSSHCTNCHHQRGQHCTQHFVAHQQQISYQHPISQKCDSRFCSCYHQISHVHLGQNYIRHQNNNSNTAHRFNRIRM